MPQNLVDRLTDQLSAKGVKNDLYSVLEPRRVEVRGARRVSFWTPTDETANPGLTPLQEAEHDYGVYDRRLEKARATGVCGEQLQLLTRQRDYRRRLFLKLSQGGNRK